MTPMPKMLSGLLAPTATEEPKGPTLNHKEAHKLARFIDEEYQKMKNGRTQFERQWYMNMSFYFGKQNVVPQTVRGVGGRLIMPPAPPWRVRLVINRTRPMIRRELSRLTSQKPSASVIPASSDDSDLFAAQAGEQIWESMYYGRNLKRILKQAVWWKLVCGNGYMKTYWDDTKTYSPTQDEAYQGDVCYSAETPFHLLVPDLREEDIEGQPWVIHSFTRTPEWLQMNYKKTLDGREVRPNTKGANDILSDAFLNLVGGNTQDYDSVLVHEMHIKPGAHPNFPDGAVITSVGEQIIQYSPVFPYQHGEFCFTKFDHIPSGKYYSTSVIEDIIPIQRELNRTRSQIVEAKNRMAKPQMIYQAGSLDPQKITTEPGQYIPYKMGFQPPEPLPMQPLPNYVLNEVQQLLQDIDDISGQHEVSRGDVPPGVTAATAISYLQEQDDSMLSSEVDSIESGMEKVARHTLSLVGTYWDIPRIVKIVGVDGSWDSAMFKGSDLKGNCDIRVEAGSALPTSKAAKQALITDWMKMGFIAPEDGMEILEMGGIQKLYERVQIDQAQARRENLKMQNCPPEIIEQMFAPPEKPAVDPVTGEPIVDPMTGQPQMEPMAPEEYMIDKVTGKPQLPDPAIPVNTFDNHAIHIDIHNRFRKSQAYEQLTPDRQLLFEIHVQKHMESIAAPHIGGMPTSEMMIGIAEQQRNQPPPTDVNTPMGGPMEATNPGEETNSPGPVAAPGSEQA